MKEHIGIKIKIARIRKGLSQQELADLIHKARPLISHIEQTGKVNAQTLSDISRALDLNTEQLHLAEEPPAISAESYKLKMLELKIEELQKELRLEKEKFDMLKQLYEQQRELVKMLKQPN